MTSDQLKRGIAAEHGITQVQAIAIIRDVFALIGVEGKAGRRVMIPGFGSFSRRHRKARAIKHPHTGEPIHLPETWAVGFTPSQHLRWRAHGE